MLFGATGRPDLLGAEHAAALARAQYGSARRLATELPGSAQLYPTHGFGSSFASYLGWLVPAGAAVTLLGETADQVARAVRELARIGLDRPRAAAIGTPQEWSGGAPLETLRLATFAGLAAAPALVAASVLAAAGREVVSVDDDFSNAEAAGLPLEHG